MPDEPIDWNHYEIRLPVNPAKPPQDGRADPAPLTPGKKEPVPARPEVRPVATPRGSRRGWPAFLFWVLVHVILIGGFAVGAGYLVESILYEQLWGPAPAAGRAFHDWISRRIFLTRFAVILGALAGAGVARLWYALVRGDD